jgi:outer membrane protein TolC
VGADQPGCGSDEQIAIARAAYYPTVSLSAAAGFEGSSIHSWLTWAGE